MKFPAVMESWKYRDPQEEPPPSRSPAESKLFRAQCRWLEQRTCLGCEREGLKNGNLVCAEGRPYGRRCGEYKRQQNGGDHYG